MGTEVTCRVPSDWFSDFSQCLYDWQTLAGSGIAVVAAFGTIAAIFCQIRQVEKHRTEEILRRHNAARVALPFALVAIGEYCRRLANHIADAIDEVDNGGWQAASAGEGGKPLPLEAVPFPSDGLVMLNRFVETLNNQNSVKHLAELSGRLQILSSRYNSLDKKSAVSNGFLYRMLIDCGIVGYLVNCLFNYARFAKNENFSVVGVDNLNDSWTGVHKAITGFVFRRPALDKYSLETWERISRFKDDGTMPWMREFTT